MNLILFEEHELGKNLSRRDERTVHLLKVLHKKTGDTFDAGLVGGMTGTGRVEKINLDGSVYVSLNLTDEPPPRHPLRVAVGFPRPIQLRRLLRDLCSLGVEAIDLLQTELGEKSYRDTNLLKDGGARQALLEGAAQSRDTLLPALSVYESLDAWLSARAWEGVTGATSSLLRTTPFLAAADNVQPEGAFSRLSPMNRPAALAVGSERGWSDGERKALEAAGFLRLSMGSRALRTETACTAAAILLLEKMGALE